MPSIEVALKAKQTLSARLLQRGLQGRVVGRVAMFRTARAIVAAGANVHAVGVGRKIVAGRVTEELAVRLYVVQKVAPSLLSPRDRLPTEIDGVPTDVIEAPPAFLLAKKKAARSVANCSERRRERQRPVIAGISTGHYEITAGTIGYFCRSLRHGDDPDQVHVLSNNHVFANVNQAQIGDDLYQPGPIDGGTAGDHFADLHRYVPLALGGQTPNHVDAAIGALVAGVEHKLEVCTIGRITGHEPATEQMPVRKHGRTTGYTEGVVTDASYDALVGMDHGDSSEAALFVDQMRIAGTPSNPVFLDGGDSGSLIVERVRAKAVGLLFAGPPSGTYGVANHIADVFNELEVELL